MNSDLQDLIRNSANRILPDIIKIRRDLHQHPELSFQEIQTGQKIQSFLTGKKIPFTSGWAGHGVVAQIEGKQPGPRIMLRADMDALTHFGGK